MEKIIVIVLMLTIALAICAGVGLLLAFPVMWCWNYAVVPTFSLPAIAWGQAWCLMFLAGMLIKSSGAGK